MPTITFVPIDRLQVQLGLEGSTLTAADEERLKTALLAATAQLEQITGRRLVPRRQTLRHAFDPRNPSELLLDEDLLELTSLTNGDGQSIDYFDIEFIGNGVLRLRSGLTFNAGDGSSPLPVVVSGVWGWHDNWGEAWRLSGDVINGALSPAGTPTLPVQDADGADPYGNTPRFKVGQLLRVSLEYMSLIAIDTELNTLTVRRGELGTLIANHEPGSTITIYTPPPQLEMLILRWAAWLYKVPENHATIPAHLLDEAWALRRVRVKS